MRTTRIIRTLQHVPLVSVFTGFHVHCTMFWTCKPYSLKLIIPRIPRRSTAIYVRYQYVPLRRVQSPRQTFLGVRHAFLPHERSFKLVLFWLDCASDLRSFWKTATLGQGGFWGAQSSKGQQNSLELALVQAKGFRVPAAQYIPTQNFLKYGTSPRAKIISSSCYYNRLLSSFTEYFFRCQWITIGGSSGAPVGG